jgi:hypothetical protein
VEPSADAGLAEFRCLGASRTDVGPKAREQHAWAATHIKAGLGGTRVDLLDRDDVAGWLDDLAECGELARRSIQICRTILRAVLYDAVEERLLRRNPAARAGMPREVTRPDRQRDVDAWHESRWPGSSSTPPTRSSRVASIWTLSIGPADEPLTGGRCGSNPPPTHITSEPILAEEEAIISWAMDAQAKPPAPSCTVQGKGLDVLQADAAAALAGADRLVIVVGAAGAGKTTTMLRAVDDLADGGR